MIRIATLIFDLKLLAIFFQIFTKIPEFGPAKKIYHCVIIHVIFVHRLVLGDQKFGFEENL